MKTLTISRAKTRLGKLVDEVQHSGPVLLSHGVSTRAIIDRIDAGESPEDVAQDYEIEPLSVEEAVLFERAA